MTSVACIFFPPSNHSFDDCSFLTNETGTKRRIWWLLLELLYLCLTAINLSIAIKIIVFEFFSFSIFKTLLVYTGRRPGTLEFFCFGKTRVDRRVYQILLTKNVIKKDGRKKSIFPGLRIKLYFFWKMLRSYKKSKSKISNCFDFTIATNIYFTLLYSLK